MAEPPPLLDLVAGMRAELAAGATVLVRRVLDPDHGRGRYAGERVERGGAVFLHRPYRVWVDLAERLGLRLLTPVRVDDTVVELRFERLAAAPAWTTDRDDPTETYGQASGFRRIHKAEDPGFVLDLALALERARLPARPRILDLGCNTGDELALVLALAPRLAEVPEVFVGIDHSASAVAAARARFPPGLARFVRADLAELSALELGRFDLVISIDTLHSPGVDDRAVLRQVVQEHLTPTGALILGFPNCRYVDGELEHGTRMKNFREPELGLLVKDVAFYRKYLQQHRRQVFVTGKDHLLVTAVARPPADAPGDDAAGREATT